MAKSKAKKEIENGVSDVPPTVEASSGDVQDAPVEAKVETFYGVRKVTLAEWQLVEIKVQGDKIIERIEREHEFDMSRIVIGKLMKRVVNNDDV
jgi:hypothetical protein